MVINYTLKNKLPAWAAKIANTFSNANDNLNFN